MYVLRMQNIYFQEVYKWLNLQESCLVFVHFEQLLCPGLYISAPFKLQIEDKYIYSTFYSIKILSLFPILIYLEVPLLNLIVIKRIEQNLLISLIVSFNLLHDSHKRLLKTKVYLLARTAQGTQQQLCKITIVIQLHKNKHYLFIMSE